MRYLLSILTLVLCACNIHAQELGIGYWELEGLYDTIPSRFYNDDNYTPSGRNRWNTERYVRAIENITSVIDSMALPIIGLYGVENENVVRDIIKCSNQDYSYVHRTRNSLDGKDFALLYFGDQLFIDRIAARRDMLIIEAQRLDSTPLTIILSRNGDDTAEYVKEEQLKTPLLILGKIYTEEIKKMKLKELTREAEKAGHGNYCSYRGWMMHDRIAASGELKILKSGVFITRELLRDDLSAPLPIFNKSSYMGGYSKYLPVFTYIP